MAVNVVKSQNSPITGQTETTTDGPTLEKTCSTETHLCKLFDANEIFFRKAYKPTLTILVDLPMIYFEEKKGKK